LPTAINIGWNTSGQIFWVFTIVFGGLGVGSLLKPDSVGAVASQLLKNLAKSEEEGPDSHNKQIQKKSSGSVQVMASDRAEVNINVPSVKKKQAQKPSAEEKEPSQMPKTFSCPKGHKCVVYPPDDNHPLASLEKSYAKENAIGTVIPMQYKCEKRGCGSQFTLYWYQEGSGAGFS
jgi:hypothetical protein